ncbi:MAG: hypothetical protein COX57_13050 [Alphaproteobacteria bacterium CG_4_10_14_0_2_um_filter_63_37]|nr:MAG: hypothetical protein AUJ55_06080 [Proteobacteria bacterium CG1_02_64_396]PJA23554.1 MAG: hypothetical protein COX57_13050 [Alphaproteobacteria bacterium CG_4_10_14_0_2_um_filter_63_37]
MNLERKRAIILQARAAARRKFASPADNPYPEGSEEHSVWLLFFTMTIGDEQRAELISGEYEASAY